MKEVYHKFPVESIKYKFNIINMFTDKMLSL